MAETGQRVGDYEVIAPLGAGGMGRVFKVRNIISNREEAMKILLPDFAADPELAARFMAEIRTLAGLEHPGIAQLRTAFQHNNQFVMVMEYVEGTGLEKIASQVRIPLDHVLDYSMQVLAALSYAHGKGVTHRDIKPANIMITTHGVVKLMDFGIAKSSGDMQLTRPGSTMGSVYYMSPEQVRGDAVDGRSDLYSFGVTLYEMLTGRKPFQADTSYSVLNAQLNEPPTPPVEVNPAIPADLNNVVLRAMAKKPEDRFQTAEEFRSALRGINEAQIAELGHVASPIAPNAAQGSQPPAYAMQQPAYTQPQSTSPQPPPFTTVPPAPMPPPRAPRTHRGLWIGMGAATALLALVAVAWVAPRIFSTHASPKPAVTVSDTPASTPAVTPDASPAPAPESATPPQTAPPSESPASTSAPTPKPPAVATTHATPHGQEGSQPRSRPAYVSPAPTTVAAPTSSGASQPPAPSGPTPGQMAEARQRFMNLEARADAAMAGVDQIRGQQQAQGLDIRGDILTAMNRLHQQLNEARQALGQRDFEAANESMNRADADTTRLEKFLGR